MHDTATNTTAGDHRPKSGGKWSLLCAYWLVQAAVWYFGGCLCAAVSSHMREAFPYEFSLEALVSVMRDPNYAWSMLWIIPLVTALQGLLLLPVRRPAPPLGAGGHSLWLTFAVVGLCAAALWGAVLCALISVWVLAFGESDIAWRWVHWSVVGLMLVGWGIATPLLISFCRRGRRETVLGRLAARLFMGTVIETAAIIPLDVMVRRKTDCYCAEGTAWALLMCLTVGAFVAGPAVIFPILARRRKRWYAGMCDACGYDMRDLPNAPRCPECGTGWKKVE